MSPKTKTNTPKLPSITFSFCCRLWVFLKTSYKTELKPISLVSYTSIRTYTNSHPDSSVVVSRVQPFCTIYPYTNETFLLKYFFRLKKKPHISSSQRTGSAILVSPDLHHLLFLLQGTWKEDAHPVRLIQAFASAIP